MEIRKFKDEDVEEVCNLIRKNDSEVTSKFYPKEVINSWGKSLIPEKILKNSKESICFVAEKDGKIVGYINFFKDEIKKLHILPDFHKQGIGKKLLLKIEKIAKKNKMDKLILYSNLYAEPFYQKCGFKKIKDIWKKVGNVKYKQIYMKKELK